MGMLPGRPAAAVRLPTPSSGRSPRSGWTHAAWASRSGTGVAWHGAAGGWSLRARQGRRTDTRSQEAGGASVRPGGGVRRRLERAGAAEWTAPALPASGLLSTSGPWSGDREVGAAAEGDAGRRPSGGRVAAPGGGGGPRRTMHLGVKPRLRVSGPLPHPLWLPSPPPLPRRRGQSHKGRASWPGLACPRAPLPPPPAPDHSPPPPGLFRIWGRRRRGEGGMVLRDVKRPETSPLMAPAHPPPSLTRRGPVEGKLFPTSEICQLHWRHLREISPDIWRRFLSSLPP